MSRFGSLSPRTYQTWWDLHAWAGAISSLVLYVCFFFGAWTLFHGPLQRWQEERGPGATPEQVDRVLDVRVADGTIAPASFRIHLPRPSNPGFSISYTTPGGESVGRRIEPDGSLVAPPTDLADFLYGLHYLSFPHAPAWFYTLAGLAAAVLLLVVVTGVLIHLRDLVPRFHQFRPRHRLRVVWSDAHKVLGTLVVPYFAVYAFTGAWMALDEPITTRMIATSFGGDQAEAARGRDGPPRPGTDVPAAGVPGTRIALREVMAIAQQVPMAGKPAPANRVCRGVYYNHVGDRDATALVLCSDIDVVLRLRDGELFPTAPYVSSLAGRIGQVPNELHFVEFAATPPRAVWALLALAGCACILTGNWLWAARRKRTLGTRILLRLTLAVGGGSLVATGALLVGNRLGLHTSEHSIFWLAWLASALTAAVVRDLRAAWSLAAGVGGLSLVAAAVLTLALQHHVGAVDVALALTGGSLVLLAAAMRRVGQAGALEGES